MNGISRGEGKGRLMPKTSGVKADVIEAPRRILAQPLAVSQLTLLMSPRPILDSVSDLCQGNISPLDLPVPT